MGGGAGSRAVPAEGNGGGGRSSIHAAGPQSWKRFLYPPGPAVEAPNREGVEIWSSRPTRRRSPPRYCLSSACGLAISGRSPSRTACSCRGRQPDPSTTAARRPERSFVVVELHAGRRHLLLRLDGHRTAGGGGFDLALTEIVREGGHRFLVEAGSGRAGGRSPGCPARPAGETGGGRAVVQRPPRRMGRSLETGGLKEAL